MRGSAAARDSDPPMPARPATKSEPTARTICRFLNAKRAAPFDPVGPDDGTRNTVSQPLSTAACRRLFFEIICRYRRIIQVVAEAFVDKSATDKLAVSFTDASLAGCRVPRGADGVDHAVDDDRRFLF